MSFDQAAKIWNVALILGDLEEYKEAEKRLREAIKGYEIEFGEEQSMLKSQYDLTPLSWAAGNGYDAVVKLLLRENSVDPDLKDSQYGRTPLSWAAESGPEAVVKLLLETGKVEVDMKDGEGLTPLWWAARKGHEAVVKLLLETGKVEVDSKDGEGLTPTRSHLHHNQ
jgi:ankyrin repeat protein